MASWIRFAEAARGVRARARLALHGGVAGSLLATCALAAGGFPARAAEGVVEINQRCADSSGPGCFPGDTPGFPVQITGAVGRNYRLTSDLRVTGVDVTAIEFSGALGGFTLDLGGFSIRGPVTCSGAPLSCSATGSGHGVTGQLGSTVSGITVRNGTISGMGDRGVELLLVDECVVEDVVVRENGRGGVLLRHGSRVDRVAAVANGGTGIQTGGGSVVVSSVARGNAATGIISGAAGHATVVLESSAIENGARGIGTSGSSAVIAESTARANGTDGIFAGFSSVVIASDAIGNGASTPALGVYAGGGSRVHGDVIRENVGTGLDFGTDSAYTDSTITDNTVDAVAPADGSRGGNLCVGAGVVGPQCP